MKYLKYLLSLPKTILFNFKVFPFEVAMKLPVLIKYDVKTPKLRKNSIEINSSLSRFMIKINFLEGSAGVNNGYKTSGFLQIGENGKIIFNGRARFDSGISIRVDKGNLVFGDNFYSNKHCFFSCSEGITIGDNSLFGWNVNVRDSDGHGYIDLDNPGTKTKASEPVFIGNQTWIAANVDVLKGVSIPDGCIVGYNSCVSRKFEEENSVIAGYPAKVLKKNIRWER